MFKIRIIIASVFICLSFFANAQFEKGKYTIGTGLSSSLSLSKYGTNLDVNRSGLEVGYFFKNNWEIGFTGDFNFRGGDYGKSSSFNLDAYSRYYLNDKKFSPFLEGMLGVGRVAAEFTGNEKYNYDATYLRAALGIGVAYKINKKWSLTTSLRYNANKYFDDSGINRDRLKLNVGAKYSF